MVKDTIVFHPCDRTACGWYRMRFPADIIQTKRFDKVYSLCSPFEVRDETVLSRAIAIYIQRPVVEEYITLLQHYNRVKNKFGFKIFADFDDLLFDIGNVENLPRFNDGSLEFKKMASVIERCLPYLDGITFANKFLMALFMQRFEYSKCYVVPNAVPSFCYGKTVRPSIKKDLTKPVVLYAGSTMYHYSDSNPGDFAGPWVPWIKKAVKEGRMDFHIFGDKVPAFLGDIADKVTMEPGTDMLNFPSVVAAIQPDFYLAPLANDIFNVCKSDLKIKEAAAIGAVPIVSSFEFGPYEIAHELCKVPEKTTVNALDGIFKELCKKDNFNAVLKYQYSLLFGSGWTTESEEYLDRLIGILCGSVICKG